MVKENNNSLGNAQKTENQAEEQPKSIDDKANQISEDAQDNDGEKHAYMSCYRKWKINRCSIL